MIIALEGIDACGKATQAELLARRFNSDMRNTQRAEVFAFPNYKSETGKAILAMLTGQQPMDRLSFATLQLANKVEMVGWIKEREQSGLVTILDRWTASAVAYGMCSGLDPQWLVRTNQILPNPDINILINISVTHSFGRRPERRDRYEVDRERMERVSMLYCKMWEDVSFAVLARHWNSVDGALDVQQVHNMIWTNVQSTPRRI